MLSDTRSTAELQQESDKLRKGINHYRIKLGRNDEYAPLYTKEIMERMKQIHSLEYIIKLRREKVLLFPATQSTAALMAGSKFKS